MIETGYENSLTRLTKQRHKMRQESTYIHYNRDMWEFIFVWTEKKWKISPNHTEKVIDYCPSCKGDAQTLLLNKEMRRDYFWPLVMICPKEDFLEKWRRGFFLALSQQWPPLPQQVKLDLAA